MKLNLKIEKPKKEEIVEPKNQVRLYFIRQLKIIFTSTILRLMRM